MSMAGMCRDLGLALVIGGLTFQAPLAWAIEVADVETTREVVAAQVERLIADAATHDPELAEVIREHSEVCLRDLSDGELEDAGLVQEVETLREVQQEVSARVLQSEVEAKIAEAVSRGNTELAESMRTAFEAFRATVVDPTGARIVDSRGDLGGFGGPGEMMSRGDARATFEQAYAEAQKRDPEGAARMKEMFEAHERGEFLRPTPEMMEKMNAEMERYMAERPEMADYARAEWDRFMEHGPDSGDRYGSPDAPEHAREAFERWAGEGGHSPGEIEHYREMMEKGMMEMERGMEMAREWEAHATERYFESPERYVETNTDTRLEQRLDSNAETLVRMDAHVADHNGDMIPETHMHEIYRHSDSTCHDHATQGPASC